MLPGFRFIVMTLLLGTSVVIFGLGAAALLRATHEEIANMPSLRTLQQPAAVFAEQPVPPAPPTLSLLRVEPQTATPPGPPLPAPTTETANLSVQPEKTQSHSAAKEKRIVKRKARKRLAHIRRARYRAAIMRTRLVQKTTPAEQFPFLFLN